MIHFITFRMVCVVAPEEVGMNQISSNVYGTTTSHDKAGLSERMRDAILVRRVRNMEAGAFDELIGRHRSRVVSVCAQKLSLLACSASGEDAAQIAFIRAYQGITRDKPTYSAFNALSPGNFRAWITTIAINVCLDLKDRQNARPKTEPIELHANVVPTRDISDPAIITSVAADGERTCDCLGLAMARLNSDDQRILRLRCLDDMATSEIADVMSWGLKKTQVRISKAKRKLLRFLVEECPDIAEKWQRILNHKPGVSATHPATAKPGDAVKASTNRKEASSDV